MPTAVHVHLVLNHVPVLTTFLGAFLLMVALLWHKPDLRQAALALFVFGALTAVAVYLSGEPAEDAVERLAGISKAAIERHEFAAGFALALVTALGAVSLGAIGLSWLRPRTRLERAGHVAPLLLAIVAFGTLLWTAGLGGQIRHTELAGDPSGTMATHRTHDPD